jgi:hypothetical protein
MPTSKRLSHPEYLLDWQRLFTPGIFDHADLEEREVLFGVLRPAIDDLR